MLPGEDGLSIARRLRSTQDMPIIILKNTEEDVVLPIWVGIFEANAIALQVENVQTPRPMTHDLLRSVVHNLGGQLKAIEVDALRDNTFFARLVIGMDGREASVDSRPSDAIAVAVGDLGTIVKFRTR